MEGAERLHAIRSGMHGWLALHADNLLSSKPLLVVAELTKIGKIQCVLATNSTTTFANIHFPASAVSSG